MCSWYYGEWRNTARWLKCRKDAAEKMLAEGWNKHARKFHEVNLRRAAQLYRKG